ncbi:MAG: hypothetical protein ACRC8S_10240 [Fimbriiglobus sp.]
MLKPFFQIAMLSPGRQLAFRRMVVMHLVLTTLGVYVVSAMSSENNLTSLGYGLLCLGIVEGAAMIGWRLTQLPKSQALEFLLTSPIQPKRMFLAEALVGVARFSLVQLAGLPVVAGLIFTGLIEYPDLLPLILMPYIWGLVAGLCLTAWVYEPLLVRRLGELLAMFGVLLYLIVGVMAAENLPLWFQQMPPVLGEFCYNSVRFLFDMNPFGIVRYWFASDRVNWIAIQRFEMLNIFAFGMVVLASVRAAFRLRGHFHDRHYRPLSSSRESQIEAIGDQPLSWWAVRRVMEYSGRVNLYLAGGACLIYAAYIVAGDHWPAWMGRNVFTLFETWGGAPTIATAMVLMAGVPAIFQFGLWDASAQDRCRRLELLLLTDLSGRDYWHASLSTSWKRGRGYFVAAAFLWLALGISGRVPWVGVIAAVMASVVMWCFLFVVGFRSFAKGAQTSGLSSMLVLGMPLLLAGFLKLGWQQGASFLPTGLLYMPMVEGLSLAWFVAFAIFAAATWYLTKSGIANCEANLRAWYDKNQGLKSVE